MGGAASPSIVPRCTLWKVRCKLFLVKPARPALSTAVPRYLLVQAVSLLGTHVPKSERIRPGPFQRYLARDLPAARIAGATVAAAHWSLDRFKF